MVYGRLVNDVIYNMICDTKWTCNRNPIFFFWKVILSIMSVLVLDEKKKKENEDNEKQI